MKKILIFILFLFLPIYLAQAEGLPGRLKGRILLQVESRGEAWYINPDNQKRFYLGQPSDAFRIMRELGLGISNKDFDSFSGVAPERLSGKILLKVEDNGEAYYVNPADLKMHYLGRPQDAFNVMSNLGLGITDSNLELIEIDTNSSSVITEEVVDDSAQDQKIISEDEEVGKESEQETGDTATSTEELITEEIATSSCVWLAEYYENYKLIGEPILTRQEEKIDHDWGYGIPEGLNRKDKFSVRWTATCYFEEGKYEFRTVFDDAIRVYLDNVNFLQSWVDNNKERILNRERNISEGDYEVKVEYYDQTGRAKISVDWVKINGD